MRSYWLRILFGAIAIFAVGMVGVTLARQGMGTVRGVVEGSGPITLPVGFIPFKLDGEKIWTIQRVKIFRNAPKQVRSVNVRVRLADSVSPGRLDPCILVAEGFEHMNSETTVLCSTAEDTVGENLVGVGEIALTKSNRSFKLYMPRETLQEMTDSEVVFVGEDSLGAAGVNADSITAAAERRVDSIVEAHQPKLESLDVERPIPPRVPHSVPRRLADSARTH
jgi:hypothetical protein